jgi:hypothetical protein
MSPLGWGRIASALRAVARTVQQPHRSSARGEDATAGPSQSSRRLDRVVLTADRELRRIDGFWYELRRAPMPDPVYRAVVEHRDVRLKPFHRRSPVVEIEVTLRRLAGPTVHDAATGRKPEVGPEIDERRK